ncbi:hypothetical protein G7046_g6585 [Stylonectria norvegica]|nr:hypothetical protein G7046_g6585 [Stylonectria norvegica]
MNGRDSPREEATRSMLLYMPNEVLDHIAEYVKTPDLFQLALVCRTTRANATRVMYFRDSTENSSSALLWAAESEDLDLGLQILSIALAYGANVNAVHRKGGGFTTTLHVAAALGRRQFTKKLLQKGANVHANSQSGDLVSSAMDSRHSHAPNWVGFDTSERTRIFAYMETTDAWTKANVRPLMFAFMRGHVAVVKLLFQAGAGGDLVFPAKPPMISRFTVLHAAVRTEDKLGLLPLLLKKFPSCLNSQSQWAMMTPLHMAVVTGQDTMVNALLEAGADFEMFDSRGRKPLHHAVKNTWFGPDFAGTQKLQSTNIVKSLVAAGAEVNQPQRTWGGETCLISLAKGFSNEWSFRHDKIKTVFDILLNAGADINAQPAGADSVLTLLFDAIQYQHGNRSLEDFFETLVKRGAEIRHAPVSANGLRRHSFLYVAMHKATISRFCHRLIDLGARLEDNEAEKTFRAWARSPKLRSKYDIFQHKSHISQVVLNRTIKNAHATGNHTLFDLLIKNVPYTGDWHMLVWMSLSSGLKRKFPDVTFTFNPSWTFPDTGQGFMHKIIEKLGKEDPYGERDAIADARLFIGRGVSLSLRDSEGMTAMERLCELNTPFTRLWRVLERATVHE